MRRILITALLLSGCGEPKWKTELAQQCAGWLSRARSASDSLTVEMNCAAIYASRRAEDQASTAAAFSAASMSTNAAGATRR